MYQNLFNAIVSITDFTPSESDLLEIIKAYEKDLKPESLEERKLKFINKVAEFKDKYPRPMLVDFVNYWTEINDNGKKEKVYLPKKKVTF